MLEQEEEEGQKHLLRLEPRHQLAVRQVPQQLEQHRLRLARVVPATALCDSAGPATANDSALTTTTTLPTTTTTTTTTATTTGCTVHLEEGLRSEAGDAAADRDGGVDGEGVVLQPRRLGQLGDRLTELVDV